MIYPGILVINAKEVQALTGYSKPTSHRLLNKIRNYYSKPQRALVTVKEFCEYTGLDEEIVNNALQQIRCRQP